jgi:hypothetical protein
MRAALRRYAAHFSRRDLLEAAIVAVAFLLYFGVRGLVADRPEAAYLHSKDILELQRSLGFLWEDDMNAWIADKKFWAQVMNLTYFYLHLPVIIPFGIWMYYFRRGKYTLTRDSFLTSGAIALVIYWLYPVAPPRELGELAARFDPNAPAYVTTWVDTLQKYLGYAYDTQSTRAFVNPYAAMPSLHFGWDLLLGLGIIRAFRGTALVWPAVFVGVFLPASQVLSITLTANHYFLDAAAGGVVAVAGIGLAVIMERRVYPWLGERLRRSPIPAIRRLADSKEGTVPKPETTPA